MRAAFYSMANLNQWNIKSPMGNLDKFGRVDWSLIVMALFFMTIGLIMSASSSIHYAQILIGDELYFFKRHSIYLLMAIGMGGATLLVPSLYLHRYSPILLILSIGLLILVLIPGIGKLVNGSRRWIDLGIITFQAAEVVKMALILFLARYLVRKGDELRYHWKGFIKPLLVMGVIGILLLLQPDFGSVVVMAAITIGILFIAGVPLGRLSLIAIMGAGFIAVAILQSPYRLQRYVGFLDPWEGDKEFGISYQLTQSLIAYGNGEWMGVGLGNSLQKLFYLPEAHTDFIIPIIAEEFGFIGVIIVLGLMIFMVARCLTLSYKLLTGKMRYLQVGRLEVGREQAQYCGYVCLGVALFFAIQCTINLAVTLGLTPTKGLTFPFISYGGSSLLISTILLAIVVRIGMEFSPIQPEAKA